MTFFNKLSRAHASVSICCLLLTFVSIQNLSAANIFHETEVGAVCMNVVEETPADYASADFIQENTNISFAPMGMAMMSCTSPVYDNNADFTFGENTSSTSESKTIPAGNDVLLLVAIEADPNGTERTINSVQFNGQNLTQHIAATDLFDDEDFYFYYLTMGDLASDVTANVEVNLSGNISQIAVFHYSFNNVNQTNPLGTALSSALNGTEISTDVTTTAGNLVIDLAGHNGDHDFPAEGANQTELSAINVGPGASTGAFRAITTMETATGTTTTMSNSIGAARDWGQIAVEVIGVGCGSISVCQSNLVNGTQGNANNNFGTSVTMDACSNGNYFYSFEWQNSSTAFTNTVGDLKIYDGQSATGTPRYTQAITFSSASLAINKIILEGGTGTLEFTPGNQYTFMIDPPGIGSAVVLRFRYQNSDVYSGGQLLFNGSFNASQDIYFVVETTDVNPLPDPCGSIVVNSTSDAQVAGDGLCTLREAIDNANSNSDNTSGDCNCGSDGNDVITFSQAGTLSLGSTLPSVSEGVTIDGTTAPGYVAGTPTFIIDYTGTGLSVSSGDVSIQGLSISNSGTWGGTGINISGSTGTNTIQNCVISNKYIGITATGAANYVVQNNDLTDCGLNNNNPALNLNAITGTVSVSGNTFGGQCRTGLRILNMDGLTIGDENVTPTPDIVIEDNSGFNTINGNEIALYISDGTNITIDDIEMTNSSWVGYGINISGNSGTNTIRNCTISNRYGAITASGAANYVIEDNDLTDCGINNGNPALYLNSITGTLSVSGNTYGGQCRTGLRVHNMDGITIGDETITPTPEVLIESTSGFNTINGNEIALYVTSGSNITIDNIAITNSSWVGYGINIAGNTGTNIVRNCTISNRYGAITASGAANFVIENNDLTDCGINNGNPALYLNSITGTLSVSGNTYGGQCRTGLRVHNMDGITIGDETITPTPEVLIESTSGFNTINGNEIALYVTSGSNITIDNIEMTNSSWVGYGINIAGNSGTNTVRNCTISNRYGAITASGAANFVIENNDFTDCGINNGNPALYLNSITGTVSASGNTFGGQCQTGLRIHNIDGISVGDENASPTPNVIIEDNSGFNTISGNEVAFYVTSGSNITIDGVEIGGNGLNVGFHLNGSDFTVQNVLVTDRINGIQGNLTGTNSITCSTFADSNDGIEFNTSVGTTTITNCNFLCLSEFGIDNNVSTSVNAQMNYFAGITNDGMVDDSNPLASEPGCAPAAPIADISVNEVAQGTDFGMVTVGQSSSITYTITNDGGSDLVLGAISSDDGQFSIENYTASTLTAGQTTTFDVEFTPASSGSKSATISIVSDDCDENPYTFSVTGEGACDIAITSVTTTDEATPCGNDGQITIVASCTTCTSIEYSIDGTNFFANGGNFTGVAPGTYNNITVRDSGDHSCNDTDSGTVNAGNQAGVIIFQGTIDDDFEVDGNWCPTTAPGTGSPITANDEVIIDADCNHIGTYGGAITFNGGITINSGNSFYTQGGGTSYINIYNKFQNDGVFEAERWSKAMHASVGTAINNGYFDVWGHGWSILCNFQNNGTIDYGEGGFFRIGTPSLDNTNGIITGSNYSGGLSWPNEPVGGIIQPGEVAGEAGTFRLYEATEFSGTVNIDVLGRGNGACPGPAGTPGTTFDRIQPFNNTDVTISGTIDFNFPTQPVNGDTYSIITTTGTVSVTGSITTSGAGGAGVVVTHLGAGVFEITSGGQANGDNQAPTANCQAYTAQIDAGGNASVSASDIDNNSSDNCGSVNLSITAGTTAYTCSDVGSDFVVTLTVDDGNGNDATCDATVTVADDSNNCPNMDALDFDLSDDYVSFSTLGSVDFSSGITIAFWVRPQLGSGGQLTVLAFDQSNGTDRWFVDYLPNNDRFRLIGPHGEREVGNQINVTNLAHLAFSIDAAGNFTSYVNGSLFTTGTGVALPGSGDIFSLGTRLDGSLNPEGVWQGMLDEVQIFNTVLCEDAIAAYMSCSLVGNEPDLQAYYDFTQPVYSTSLPDVTGNGHDGTLHNFALSGSTSAWITPGGTVSGSCTAFVDSTNPTITCPGDVSGTADNNLCTSSTISLGTATGNDDCGSPTITNDAPAAFTVGMTTVTWTATDGASNTATCTQTVTVTDEQDPTISCPSNITTTTDSGVCTAAVNYSGPTFSDNCSTATSLADYTTSGTYNFTVPAEMSELTITAVGADGGNNGSGGLAGTGASMTGTFSVNPGDELLIIVGEAGHPGTGIRGGGGGGGTAVINSTTGTVLIAAGAGTGAPRAGTGRGGRANPNSTPGGGAAGGQGSGGGGFNGDGVGNGCASPGLMATLAAGGNGGVACENGGDGGFGFGGGGSAGPSDGAGGGGGYQGGRGGHHWQDGGDGGDSFNTGSDQVNVAGTNAAGGSNDGSVSIGANLTVNQTAGLASGSNFQVGTTTNTYTITDASGNTANCSFTVTVTDNEDPTITCRNIDAELTASEDVVVNPADLVVTSNDNCGNVSLSIDGGSVTYECSDLGAMFTITVTATDDAGNTETCDATITVTDPNEHCCDISIDDTTVVVPSCPGGSDGSITVTASCNLCTSIEYSIDGGAFGSSNSFSGLAAGDYDIAVRDSGNHGCTTTQTVTVGAGVDSTDPVITCPGAQTVSADASCAGDVPDLTGLASATDNCSDPGNITITQDIASGTALTLNTATTVTLTATDEGTNTHTCTVDVTLIDDTAPDVTCPADVPMNTGPDFCSASVFLTPPTATDNCSSTFTITASAPGIFIQNPFPGFYFAQFPAGTTTVTWTVTDENGQSETCTNDVIVTDNSPPSFSNCPTQPINVISDSESCGTNATWGAIFALDNCGTQLNITVSHNSGDFFPVGTTTVTYTVTDPGNNSTDCMFDVIVTDDTPPIVSCQDVEVFLDASGAASVAVADVVTGVTDNCTVDMAEVSLDISSFDCSQAGTAVTVTASVNDLNGVSGSCTAQVTVTDNTNPTAVCQDVTVSLDASGMGSVDASDLDDGSDDNCPNHTIAITDGQSSYDCTDAGQSYTLTLTVTDASNNTATCTSTVSVVDDTNPTITCPVDVSVGTDAGECTAVVTFTDPAGADNCSGHTVEQGEGMASGSAFPTGDSTVGYTVTDASGNTATCSFTITVSDDENPAIAGCPSDITQGNDNDACNAVVNWTAPTASDNCGVDSFTSTHSSGDTFDVGTETVTYTAMDEAGNSSTCSFTVTVNDTQNPEITCPADMSVGTDAGVCTAVVTYSTPSGTDNCAGQTTELVAGGASGSTFDLGETTVTYSVTDAAGNEASCSFTVTVSDDENPAITVCPDDVTIDMDSGECDGTVTDLVAGTTATDNCTASVTITQSPTAGSTFGAAHGDTQTVTITATDEAGNESTCDVVLTLNDNQDPTITACPADIVQATDADVCTAVVNWTAPTGDDNCAGTVGSSHDSGDTFDLGTTEVTYSVTDAAGNQVSCSFNVTINDEQDPAITCPSDISVGTDDNVCTAVVTYTAPVGTDNCTGATTELVAGGASGTAFDLGSTTVTYTVTDAAGNEASCSFTVTVSDDEDPVITDCADDQDVNVDVAACTATVPDLTGDVTSTDNCTGSPVITQSPAAGSTFGAAHGDTQEVTMTSTDEAGNTETCTLTLTLNDNIPPTADCVDGITVSLDSDGAASITTADANDASSDNCTAANELTLSLNDMDFDCTDVAGGATVTLTVTDLAGNESTCDIAVTVLDEINPAITCPADISVGTDDNVCTAVVTYTAPEGTDNCAGATTELVAGGASGSTFDLGTTEVTYSVTDASGNTASCSFNVTVSDDENPVITVCPDDATIDMDAGVCEGTVTDLVALSTATDNCTASVTITQSPTVGSTFGAAHGDTQTVTITATDEANNSSTCTVVLTLNDNQDPTITACPADIVQATDADVCTAVVNWTAPTGADNCAGTVGSSHDSGDTFDLGTTEVTYSVTDAAGNQVSCSFNVTINDEQDPAITCPDNIEIGTDDNVCTAVVTYTAPEGTDNCTGATTELAAGGASGSTFDIGATTVTYTVTDAAGNEASCSFTVTVSDDENPTIAGCPSNISQNNDAGNCSAAVSWTAPTADDNCGVASFTSTSQIGDTFDVGDTDVTYTAVDEAGNEHTCTFTITVVDAENPQITCPANITVNNDAGVCGAEVTYTPPVGTDNCEGSVTSLDEGQESGTVFAVGTTNVSYSVVDAAGNSASCSFTVTVNDNENPTIADCPENITQNNDTGICGAIVNWTAPTADDNCNVASFTSDHNIGDTFPVGDTEVTYTATDDASNSLTCSFTITVVDAEAPQITCPANITQDNDAGECSAVVNWTAPVGTDNCPGSVTELQTTDYPIGATFPLGSTDVTYSVADAAGNETSCTFSVTIVDAENPVAICQDITVDLDASGAASIEAGDVNNNSTDNCNIASMSVDPRIFDCSHVGANTVTLTVVDDAGNEHTCDATVTIEDNVAPVALCQDITIDLDENGSVSIVAEDVDNTSTDACGIAGLAIDMASFDCSNLGANTVTLTVTDNNNNESTCESTVTVEDNVAPVISDCPENISVDAISTSCAASASWTEPTYSDNCVDYSVSLDTEGVATIDLGTVVFGTFPGGETTISYTVTDPQGNESICSFTVTVVDNVGPVLTGCPDDIVVDNTSGECSGQAFWTAPIPSDNCTGVTLTASHNSGESFEIGSTTVNYTASDAHGNESTCSFVVTVNDTEAPTVDCPETVEADAAGDCGYQIPDLSGLVTSSDNCEGDVTVTQSPAAGSPTPGATSVTVTVSDGTNSADCSVSITVPDDLSLSTTSTDASCDDSSDGSATVTISGGTAPYTISWSSGGDSETENGLSVGDHTVDVTDANGCTASATVTIGSNDTTPPTLFCDDHTVSLDANGEASITINDVAIVMEDNCGLASMSISQDNFTCANIGANTVTVTVTDAAGLTSTCDATVTVEDNMVSTPPFCGSTIDLQLGSDGLVSIGAGNFDPVMDNCGTALDILILGQSTFTCGFSGLSLVVPVAVLDESENFSICTVTVNISDAIAPTAVCENTTVSLGSDGTASIGASDVDGGSDDNCGIESSIVTPSSFDCGDLGANTVTLVVTDEGGLTASCTATVTVVDDSAPTPLYCDDQVSLVLDASGSASLTTANFDSAVDNCTSSPTISILGQSSFDCSDAGNTIVVAVSATDAQSNVAQCNINVSVVDNTDPVALCQDASVVADGNGIATVDASAINNASFDNCSIASMTATPNTFSCSGDSDNVVTLTVTDPSGNTATCTATVTVTGGGGAGLQANCQDVTVSLDASGNASITAADIDNGSFGCGVSLSVSPSSFTCANAGNNQVTLTATESGGGTATCTAMVMVVDDINPVASCQDISVTLDAGTGMAVIVGGDVNDGSTDNCGVDVMNVSPSVFTCEDGGDNTVTLTVTDAAGNSSTCAARVSVGYAAPTAMCQASAVTVGLGDDGTATVDPAVIDNGSSGMCDDLTMSVLPATFDCADAGSNPITLIVTDGLGQTASCTATVNIVDNSVPMPDFCGGSVNIELDADGSVNIEESGFGTHLDNCGSTPLVIISLGQINFTCADLGTTSDLLVAMIDGAGNLVTCFTDVVVTDPDGHCGSGLMVNEDLLNGVQTAKAEKPQIEVWQPELDENQNSLELRGLTNTPNPFSYQTKISYRLTAPAEVQMWVMDESGRMVTTLTRGAKAAGEHNVFWQPGANVAHGVYFLMVRLDNGHIAHLKMHYTR